MNKSNVLLSEEALITSANTDFSRHLTLSSLVDMHIQIAWHHAEHLGFGMEFLHEHDLVWMISRVHIRVHKYPFWNEKIKMETWPKGIRRLFYLRDFRFRDLQGNLISEATSEFLIINWKSRRPKLYNPENNIFKENLNKHALNGAVPQLSTPDSDFDVFTNKVVYSDVDLNQHLTTTRYLEWILDCFDLEYLRQNRCTELVVNFMKEIPYGSQVEIRRFKTEKENTWQYEFVLPENDTTCFRGLVGFTAHESI